MRLSKAITVVGKDEPIQEVLRGEGLGDEFAPRRYAPPRYNPGRCDILLRPSLELAEKAMGLTSVWLGEDIVIEDVELTLEGISEPASPSPGSAR
jgi:hypothetical protein